MEASVRLFNSSSLLPNRHSTHSIFYRNSLKLLVRTPSLSIPRQNPKYPISARIRSSSFSVPYQHSFNSWNSNPLGFFLSSLSPFQSSFSSNNHFSSGGISDLKKNFLIWDSASNGVTRKSESGFLKDQNSVSTVVLLGWLGADHKHLKRYVELYTSKGIRAVTFVVPAKELLGFDLGKRVEKRVSALAEELVSWLSDNENDGKERNLIFHTFSNTGWLAYGALLQHLQSSGNFLRSIKGCVVDSGAAPELNPKVWAAGFSAAMLKKRGSSILPSEGFIREANGSTPVKSISKVEEDEPFFIETMLLAVLEKFFSFVLKLPEVNQKLTKIISLLSNDQPTCPQLYLYSTADRVIPFQSVESFIKFQKGKGRDVGAYNFESSPHVDHLRSFPHVYSEVIHKFLKGIVAKVDHS
ncbi:hypothetical protein MKX01_016008 [Papaver californicum]|nr:hypothetical protein MKX01_016008 [Papaver californicum]